MIGAAWRVQHADCAIKYRGTPDPAHEARQRRKDTFAAKGTGRQAQRARKRLRDAMPPAETPTIPHNPNGPSIIFLDAFEKVDVHGYYYPPATPVK